MRGEGERKEGEDNSEDPFEKYAEELSGKYEETSESDESPGAARSVSAPDQVEGIHEETAESDAHAESTESSKDSENSDSVKQEDGFTRETVENREDEFEAYAKELNVKYDENDEGNDSIRAQESNCKNDDEATLQEERDSHRQDGRAKDELKESAASDIQWRADGSEEKSTEVGGYQQIGDDRKEKEGNQVASSNPGGPNAVNSDEIGSEVPKTKFAGDDEPVRDNTTRKPSESTYIGVDESKPDMKSKDLATTQTAPTNPKGETDSPQENPNRRGTVAKLTETERPTLQTRTRMVPPTEISPDKQNTLEKPGIDDRVGTNPKSSRASDYQSENNPISPRRSSDEEFRGNIEQPRETSVVLLGQWEKRAAYVSLSKTFFQELTGTKLQTGKTYEIRFAISGVGESWTRHTETMNQAEKPTIRMHVSQILSDKLHVGSRYNVAIDCVTDKRCLRVTSTHQGPALKIYRHYLESMELGDSPAKQEKNPVVELGVKNLSLQNSRMDKCYTTFRFDSHKSGYDICRLLVKRLGAKQGDVMEVQYAKYLTIGRFAENFNSHRPRNLENVSLVFSQDKLSMIVDEKALSLLNPRLSTNKLQVCLKAELEQTGKTVFFWSGGENTRMNFLQKWPVRSMSSMDSGIDITYRMGIHHTPTFRFRTDKFDASRLRNELRLVSSPEYAEDSYIFRASPRLQELVRSRINAAHGPFDARCEKGDISEEIQRFLLSSLGRWEEIEYHPFDQSWRTHESKKRGPDSVQRSKSSGELSYFEFRWSTDSYQAYFSCRRQALGDLTKWPTYKDESVKKAYVGTLDWDVRKSHVGFCVREATPDEIGHKTWKV